MHATQPDSAEIFFQLELTIINDQAAAGNPFKDSVEKDIYRSKDDFPFRFKKGSSDIDIIFASSVKGSYIQLLFDIKSFKIPIPGVRGALNVKNADIHANDYADVYVGDNSEQIQAYDRSGPVKEQEEFSLEEIEMQWICMESRGKSGRPGHPSYDPNPEWSDCNQAISQQFAPVLLLISLLNAYFQSFRGFQ